ncbi:MAG: hypothetical protein IT456_06145 [Planctomycetes bacterium]|nr:hypothetical protein [Planctomycetota bacterium]
MFRWLRSLFARIRPPAPPGATVELLDATGWVTAIYPDGRSLTISWHDLAEVEVHTNECGPLGIDVWWVLRGTRHTCIFPADANGADAVLRKLQTLPGFDQGAFLQAMGSTAKAVFPCWRRPPAARSRF